MIDPRSPSCIYGTFQHVLDYANYLSTIPNCSVMVAWHEKTNRDGCTIFFTNENGNTALLTYVEREMCSM